MNRTEFMPQYIFDWLKANHFEKSYDCPEYENYIQGYNTVHLRAHENNRPTGLETALYT